MALSNWDTLSVNHLGESTCGDFESPKGVKVEIYKNWIYVHDEQGWSEGGFTKPVVMQIQSGVVHYKDVEMGVFRGPQGGVFVIAHSGYEHRGDFTGMIGCGVYGYEGDEFVGVTPETLKWFRELVSKSAIEKHSFETRSYDGDEVKKETVEFEELEYKIEVPMPLRWALVFSDAARFNQGDAYFAAHLGNAIPATAPGEAQPTMMSGIISNMKVGHGG